MSQIAAEKDSKSGPFSSEWDTHSHLTDVSSQGSGAEDKEMPRRSGRTRTPAKGGGSSTKKSKHSKEVVESPARKKSE